MLFKSLDVFVASLLLSTSVLGAATSNSSQHVIPNAAGDTTLDLAKVNRYKSLLG